MHILFFTDNFYPEVNACASRVYERAKCWVKWGHKVTVVTSVPNFPEGKIYSGYQNKWFQKELIDGIEVIRVKTFIARNIGKTKRIIDFLSYAVSTLLNINKYPKTDVIVATTPQFFCAVSAMLISKFKKTPFVVEVSDLWPESICAVGAMKKNFLLNLIEKLELYLYKSATKIILLTNAFKKNLTDRNVTESKMHVVLNGADVLQFEPLEANQNLLSTLGLHNKFVIGYIGTFGMAQDLIQVLYLAEKLIDEKDIHFIFVGAGAEKELLISYQQNNSLSNVTFIDKQPKNRINDYWSICHIALVHLKDTPAFASVIPSKIFEAMAAGKAILLISPQGEAAEIMQKTQSGLFHVNKDTDNIAKSIRKLKQEPLVLKAIANNAITASKNFTREKQARLFLDVLKATSLSG